MRRFPINAEGIRRCFLTSLCLLGLLCTGTVAQVNPAPGLNALPEVAFSSLSQHDTNPLGARALALQPEMWKHSETEHFIYHYQRSFVASAVAVEAEFHFRVVTNELGQAELAWPRKAHIYIFEQPADWEAFQTVGGLEPWTGGIQSGGSLFIVRNPAYRFTDNSLGHEVAHLVLHQLYGIGVPLWLNEGFAQYTSKNAHASFQRARGYRSKPWSNRVAAADLFPLATLATMRYPAAERVEAFYDQSERLVRFLAGRDKGKFLELLEAVARGETLGNALARVWANEFQTVAALEEKFARYVSQEFAAAE